MAENWDTQDDMGNNPVESLQEYFRHAENVQELQVLARKLDGLADSMDVKYDDKTELGEIRLYKEFYDDD